MARPGRQVSRLQHRRASWAAEARNRVLARVSVGEKGRRRPEQAGHALALAGCLAPSPAFPGMTDRNRGQASGPCRGLQARPGGSSFGITQIWVQIPALTPHTRGLGPAPPWLRTGVCSSAKAEGRAGLPHRSP